MNTELLLRVKRAILTHPKNFDMSFFQRHAGCGTTCCIAGWAVALSRKESIKKTRGISLEAAMNALEIGYSEAYSLFHAHRWPSQLWDAYCDAKDAKEESRVGADAIDHFIKTHTP